MFLSPHSDPQADLGEPDAGGQCVYEHQLALELANNGIEVTTVCRQTGQRPDISQVNDNYQILRIEAGRGGFVPKERMEVVLPELVNNLMPTIYRQPPDLLHAHYWDGGKTALMIKANKTGNIPLVFTPHSLGDLKRGQFPTRRNEFVYNFIPRLTWENYTLQASEQVVVSSQTEKVDVVERYGVDENKIKVIAPGIDIDRLGESKRAEARKRLGLPQKEKILLALGRLTPSKGYQEAIEIFSEFKKRYQGPAKLLIIGGGEKLNQAELSYRRRLEEVAKSLRVFEAVVFRPALPYQEVGLAYAAADIFLLVSKHEPFGLTVLEAMASKTPVIAFNRGGPAEILRHNETGCLVPYKQPVQAAYYALSLIKDRDYREKIIRQAEEEVKRKYTWIQRTKEFIGVYQQAIEEKFNFRAWFRKNYFLWHNLRLQQTPQETILRRIDQPKRPNLRRQRLLN